MNRPTNDPPHKCINCRRPYEHTHPWAKPLRLCKKCADLYLARTVLRRRS
jgi:hypothetical protein